MQIYIVRDPDGTVGVRESYESARALADDFLGVDADIQIDIEVWDTENEEWGYATVARRYEDGVWSRFVEGDGWLPEGESAKENAS